MKTFLAAAAGLALLAGTTRAGRQPQPAAQPRAEAPDYQDIVYLGEDRPVFFRLHVRRDGKPFAEPWHAYVKELFQFLDRDGDGFLTKDEAARVPSAQQLLQQFQGAIVFVNQVATVRFEDLDADRDGKVTLEELAGYYRRSGVGPLQVNFPQGPLATTDALTEALFQALDENKDGKLSREELARADRLLQRFDFDDDEMVSAQELGGNPNNQIYYRLQAAELRLARLNRMPRSNAGAFFPVHPDGSRKQHVVRAQLVHQLLSRYDRDKNQQLSREEIGLDRATFDRLDANHDGQLSAAELMEMLRQPPHLELVMRLGKTAANEARVDLAGGQEKPAPLAAALSKSANGTAAVALADVRFNLQAVAVARDFRVNTRNYRQFYTAQFKAADLNKDGVLDIQEIAKSRFRPYFQPLLQIADRNEDGELSLDELNAYLDLTEKGVGCMTAISIINNGRGLFGILDANGDGRLSIRELRGSWARVAGFDKGGKGHVTRRDIPLQFQVTADVFPSGYAYAIAPPARSAARGTAVARRSAPAGPLWFYKMDRNGDGDVSRREFLGSAEDFRRIDTDGDGLISLNEAKKADEWFRTKPADPGP